MRGRSRSSRSRCVTRGKTRRRRGASREGCPPRHCDCPESRECQSRPWQGWGWEGCRDVWSASPPQSPSHRRWSSQSCRSGRSRSRSFAASAARGSRCSSAASAQPGPRGSRSSSGASQAGDRPVFAGCGSSLHPSPSSSCGLGKNTALWHFAQNLPRSWSPGLPLWWQMLKSQQV